MEEYNAKARLLMERHKDQLTTLFINAATPNKAEMNVIIEIASENNVTDLPSVLLLNRKGEPFKVIAGKFDDAELEKAIKEIVQ